MPFYWVTATATYIQAVEAESPSEAVKGLAALSEGRNGWQLTGTKLSAKLYEVEEGSTVNDEA